MHRILHLEDSTNDAELTRALLTAHWPESTLIWVTNRNRMREELATHMYALVIIDSELSQPDEFGALRIARATAPDIPIVVYSGRVSEESRRRAEAHGATLVVSKANPDRLVAAIQQLLP